MRSGERERAHVFGGKPFRPPSLKKEAAVSLTQGFFFGVGPKTQGRKNSNSSNFSNKLKQNFPKTQKTGKF